MKEEQIRLLEDSSSGINFSIGNFRFEDPRWDRPLVTTGRNHILYPLDIDFNINPRLQYIEVGAGLGGFIKFICDRQRDSSPKPVVIDPADYARMEDMLKYCLDTGTSDREIIEELLERCELLLNKDRVILINKKLDIAIQEHPEILETADVVIDNYGACYYEAKTETERLEKMLLKPERRDFLFCSSENFWIPN
jgi:hypothetical protein